jgi:hypothetical protein
VHVTITVMRVDAHRVKMGDILDLNGRVVTQAGTDGETVTIHCGPNHRILTDHSAPVRVRRRIREVILDEDPDADGHVWYVEKTRPY